MITAIEEAAVERIVDRLAGIRKTGGKKAGEGIGPSPSVDAGCLEAGFRRVSKRCWSQEVTLSLLVTLANPKSEEARRKGINPLIQAIVQLLLDQKLDLEISALQPVNWREVTNEDDHAEGKIRYLIKMSTSFDIEKQDDEEVDDLLTVGLSYLLKPGDAVADATDTIDLPDLPKG